MYPNKRVLKESFFGNLLSQLVWRTMLSLNTPGNYRSMATHQAWPAAPLQQRWPLNLCSSLPKFVERSSAGWQNWQGTFCLYTIILALQYRQQTIHSPVTSEPPQTVLCPFTPPVGTYKQAFPSCSCMSIVGGDIHPRAWQLILKST